MKAAIYCRVSTTMQEDNYSLPTQEDACRKHAAVLGYTVAALYQDIHSGYELWERKGLTALREAARAGAYDAIIAYEPDRLSRRQIHSAVLVADAMRDSSAVVVLYVGLDGGQGARVLWPNSITLTKDNKIVAKCYCTMRKQWKTFRIDRMLTCHGLTTPDDIEQAA